MKFDHDFVGRAALEAEVANPKRTIATLRWNPDDVVDIYASLLQPGEEYKTIDLPTSPPWTEGMNSHADHLLKDGAAMGIFLGGGGGGGGGFWGGGGGGGGGWVCVCVYYLVQLHMLCHGTLHHVPGHF